MNLSTSRSPAGWSLVLVPASTYVSNPQALGQDYAALDGAAAFAVDVVAENPRPLSLDSIRSVLENAWRGERPV